MAINGSTLRMTGTYSGFDTDSIVKSMMQIEQLKLDRQTRSLTTMQWKQESYNTVSSDLKTFLNDFISTLGSNSMMKSSNYVTFKATASGKSSDAVTVSGTAEASAGTVTIDSITNLAKSANATSSAKVSKGSELAASNSTQLKDLDFAKELEFVNDEISFAVNGESFTFKSTDTLQTMMNKVNASDAGVTMSYSRLTDTLSFASKETGAETSVEIRNIKGNAFGSDSAFGIDNGTYKNGEDAKLSINGTEVTRSSNDFTLDGIRYSLTRTFEAADGPVTVKLERDVSTAVDNIKKFVEGYNTLINKLTDLVNTRKTTKEKSYTPLTEEEKSSMTEEQIETWEEVAKKGLLYNDAGLQGLLSGLRTAMYDTVQGLGMSAADIGLRTGEYASRGEIALDEDVLRSALEKDPNAVMDVFMNISDSADASTAYKENGFLKRIDTLVNNYMKGSGQTSLDNLETQIYRATSRISDMEDRMLELEEKYYLKYAALEEAMASMSSQSNSLATLLGTSS